MTTWGAPSKWGSLLTWWTVQPSGPVRVLDLSGVLVADRLAVALNADRAAVSLVPDRLSTTLNPDRLAVTLNPDRLTLTLVEA
jgi:hypothetical protein